MSVSLYMWCLSVQMEQISGDEIADWGLGSSWRNEVSAFGKGGMGR